VLLAALPSACFTPAGERAGDDQAAEGATAEQPRAAASFGHEAVRACRAGLLAVAEAPGVGASAVRQHALRLRLLLLLWWLLLWWLWLLLLMLWLLLWWLWLWLMLLFLPANSSPF
jgi:hypothetical protein